MPFIVHRSELQCPQHARTNQPRHYSEAHFSRITAAREGWPLERSSSDCRRRNGVKYARRRGKSAGLASVPFVPAIFKETEQYKNAGEDNNKHLIPRLGYVAGCRIEELCSLTGDQITTDPETKITYMEVREGKTDNAKRRISLHDWIAADVIQQRDTTGTGLLFPALTTQRNDGKHSDKVSKWFGRVKKNHRMSQCSKAFHSFRVHVETNLERGCVAESTAMWVLGHTRNLSLTYGLYSEGMDLNELKDAIDVIPARW